MPAEKTMKRIRLTTALLIALAMVMPIAARQQATQPESGLLTLGTIFTYAPQHPGELQWQADGSGYFMLEPSAVQERSRPLRRARGCRAKTLVLSSAPLVPAAAPLAARLHGVEHASTEQDVPV